MPLTLCSSLLSLQLQCGLALIDALPNPTNTVRSLTDLNITVQHLAGQVQSLSSSINQTVLPLPEALHTILMRNTLFKESKTMLAGYQSDLTTMTR